MTEKEPGIEQKTEGLQYEKFQRFPEAENMLAGIAPVYKTMLNRAAVHLARGRWWNLWHTVMSVDFLKRIITAEKIYLP